MQAYKDIGNTQAIQAREKAQKANEQKLQPVEESKSEPVSNWRTGNFLEAKKEVQAEKQLKQQQVAESTYGANISSIEVKPMSKHAKRRANKKAREANQPVDQPVQEDL